MAETAPDPRESFDTARRGDPSVAMIRSLCRIGLGPAVGEEDRLLLAAEVVREALRADRVEIWLARGDGDFAPLGRNGGVVSGVDAGRWRARLLAARASFDTAAGPLPTLEAAIVGAAGILGVLRCSRTRGSRSWTRAEQLLAAMAADRLAVTLEAVRAQAPAGTDLGAVLQGFAHDLGNTLTTALGHVQLIAAAPADLARDDSARNAMAALDFACQLTRQMTGLGDGRARGFAPLSIDEVVRSVDRLLHAVVGRDRTLALDLAAADERLHGDAPALRRLLLNLVANAKDATGPGGSIRVATRGRALGLELCVHDDGVGMNDEVRSRMFEPGFSTRHTNGGSGLGLAAVRAIADAHAASIAVDSAPGHGTTVVVRFPAAG